MTKNTQSSIHWNGWGDWGNFPLPKVEQLPPQLPDVYELLSKEEGMLQSGKHF